MDDTKQLIFFDLDGTLAESKQTPDHEIAELICRLLLKYYVAVISGGSFEQFQKQLLAKIECSDQQLEKLFILPTSGAALFHYTHTSWQPIYEEKLSSEDCKKISDALDEAKRVFAIPDETEYGHTIENRGSQFTFSALGQHAPLEVKKDWDPHQEKRREIVSLISTMLPEFTITMGGMTSIDITKKGVDKAYGIRKLATHTSISINQMYYVGDALYPGGNDEVAKSTGIECVQVNSVEETKDFIRKMIA